MPGIEILSLIVIGFIGISYPIIMEAVSRLDDRYKSEALLKKFHKEDSYIKFNFYLRVSAVVLFVYATGFLNAIPLASVDCFGFFDVTDSETLTLNHLIKWPLLFFTTTLTYNFFKLARRILHYYRPIEILDELSIHDIDDFAVAGELMLNFEKNGDHRYTGKFGDFFYTAFKTVRERQENQAVVYPALYYSIVYNAIEELAVKRNKRNYLLISGTSGAIWLLGELPGYEISEQTYRWLWQNLLLALNYERDDLIIHHWESCHQYYIYNLKYIDEIYDNSGDGSAVVNKLEVDKRKAERSRFIEFHYVLGGLLLYKERYDCIGRMFNYTQSDPPSYDLLPSSMNEIFKFYNDLRDPYDRKYYLISYQYPFPSLSGVSADSFIKKWIMSYMAILFLRQYTIYPYLIYMEPLKYPTIPKTQGEIKKWIDGLDFFKNLVIEHLQNTELLRSLGLDFITEQWCEDHKKPYPIVFIENFKSKLENAYHINAINLVSSGEKIRQFKSATTLIIEKAVSKIMLVNNEVEIEDDKADKWYVHGQKLIENKDTFSDNPEMHIENFDTFLGAVIARSLTDGLGDTFFHKRSKSYLLKSEHIFEAIDKMKIDEGYVIVNFGLSLNHFINDVKVEGLSSDRYKNISIYTFDGSDLVRDCLFILNKFDLPSISIKPIDNSILEKYQLDKISETIDLYSSVIDLHNPSDDILEEVQKYEFEGELDKSVLMSIFMSTEFKWKKEVNVIQLNRYSEYLQRGLPNKLSDVELF